MGEIMKRTEEWRVETEEQAVALIEQAKENEKTEGYELVSYTSTHKTKKDDDFYIVKLVKAW
jgi:ribosomal 30S subunit maturation factor RimM